jgi:hypothetical protein
LLKLDISKANGRILVVDETSNSVETNEWTRFSPV